MKIMQYKKEFLCKHFIHDQRFYRYILVGILNTIFSYAVYYLLILFGLHYTMAIFVATVAGILFNFKTTGVMVFNNSNNRLIIKFFIVYGIIYLINISIIKIMLFFCNNLYLNGFIAMMIAAPISFLLNKEFVFKEKLCN